MRYNLAATTLHLAGTTLWYNSLLQHRLHPEKAATVPQSHACVYLHAVFSTKDRRPFLRDQNLRDSVHEYLGGVSKNLDCVPIRIGGIEDHVHILARFGRTLSIAEWIKELKRVSSLWIHAQPSATAEFSWQSGYGVFSVSQSNVDQVTDYISQQEVHHGKLSFQDELRILFRKHQIDSDEKYMWD